MENDVTLWVMVLGSLLLTNPVVQIISAIILIVLIVTVGIAEIIGVISILLLFFHHTRVYGILGLSFAAIYRCMCPTHKQRVEDDMDELKKELKRLKSGKE